MIDITSLQNGETSSTSAYHTLHSKAGRYSRNFSETVPGYPSSLLLFNGQDIG
jgi:hypothetical protein